MHAVAASDSQLVAAYDQLSAAMAAAAADAMGPTLETVDGPMPRPMIETIVGLAMQHEGIDAATVPTMTDEELVASYDRYGSSYDLELRGDGELPDDELFAGCPA